MAFGSPDFWLALGTIIWVNILLSGDNAVVVALAARSLPAQQQRQAIVWGSAAAIVMRIGLTVVAARLLELPLLKIIGAILLLYIGVTLLVPDDDDDDGDSGTGSLMGAIRTILIADLVMSLDNVIAVAAAAHGSFALLVIGLASSIPIVIFGSALLIKVIDRLPVIVWAGAGLLGYLAGEILIEDPLLAERIATLARIWHTTPHGIAVTLGVIGAVLVVLIGKLLLMHRSRKSRHGQRPATDRD